MLRWKSSMLRRALFDLGKGRIGTDSFDGTFTARSNHSKLLVASLGTWKSSAKRNIRPFESSTASQGSIIRASMVLYDLYKTAGEKSGLSSRNCAVDPLL